MLAPAFRSIKVSIFYGGSEEMTVVAHGHEQVQEWDRCIWRCASGSRLVGRAGVCGNDRGRFFHWQKYLFLPFLSLSLSFYRMEAVSLMSGHG